MNELKFNSKVCTTKEQSRRLLDLGLKPETADMCYTYKPKHLADTTPEEDWVLKVSPPVGTDIPAWSLHRLMLICAEYYLSLHLNIKNIRLYDHIIDIIENLIKLEKIDKKYLQ